MSRTDMPMPLPVSMYAHDRSVSATRPPSTIRRSRLSRRSVSEVFSAAISDRAMPHHAVVVEVQVRELPVAGLQIEDDVALRLGGAASDLGDLEFEAGRQIDTRPGLCPSYRVLDGLAAALDQARHDVTALARFHVHVEVDLGEDRIIDFHECREVDGEHCRHRIRILACHDLEQRLALLGVGPFVDKRLSLAAALVDRARPLIYPANTQTIELHIAVVALFDLNRHRGLAVPVRRQRIELTRTPIGA